MGPTRRAPPAAFVLAAMLPFAAGPAAGQSGKAVPVCNAAAFRVVLDVGHTAQEPGAISARGVGEYDFNLRLARRIEAALLEKGFAKTAVLVRSGPNRPKLGERAAAANSLRPDVLLSIHHDSVPLHFIETWEYEGAQGRFSDRFKGHSIFVSNENPHYARSLAFARALGLALKARGLAYTPHYADKIMGARRRILVDAEAGVYRFDQLVMLKDTRMPAALLEAGSIINRDEELAVQSPERITLVAAATTEAVEAFCAARKGRG